jgi:secretion/DNA translocation related TadE-like protein
MRRVDPRRGANDPEGGNEAGRGCVAQQDSIEAGRPFAAGRQQDGGVATIWTAMAVAALAGVAVLACWLGGAVLARHRAESAADLGALAAASHAAEGPTRACERARWVADRMAVSLLTCRWQRLDAFVEVQAPGLGRGLGLAGLPGPLARARAGPNGQP